MTHITTQKLPTPSQRFSNLAAVLAAEAGVYWIPFLVELLNTHEVSMRTASLTLVLYVVSVAIFLEDTAGLIYAFLIAVFFGYTVVDSKFALTDIFRYMGALDAVGWGKLLAAFGVLVFFGYLHYAKRHNKYWVDGDRSWITGRSANE